MTGLTVQNFASAAVGMAVAAAFARGLARSAQDGRVGNFWADLVRGVLRVLLPISRGRGAASWSRSASSRTSRDSQAVQTLAGGVQHVTGGPVASQEAIKELGTNGGGFYNANSAHPFENPTPADRTCSRSSSSSLIPFAMAWAFGLIVGDRRQGGAVLAVMALLLGVSIALLTWAEMAGPGIGPGRAGGAHGGQGDPLRRSRPRPCSPPPRRAPRPAPSTPCTTRFTAPGGGVAMFNMMLGEIAPGGVGSGLYGMLMLAVVTVFLSGLMVGRTPEYLGKKIGQPEIVAGRFLRADHARPRADRRRHRD